MLGVVRVYSRKSEFVLKDVQSIVDALKRLDVHTQSKSSGRKRGRDVAPSLSTRGGGIKGISLEEGQDLARLDMITLPVSKKHRTRTYAIPSLGKGRSLKSRYNEVKIDGEQSVASLGDISISMAPELDVFEAMETLFPSVVVPRFGQQQRGTSRTPSSDLQSETQRSLLHRAREEDITLVPSTGFGNLRQELFLEDLPVSLESQQPSVLIQPEPVLSSGEDQDGIRPFAVGSDVPSSAMEDVYPPRDSLPPQDDFVAALEPEDIEPLQIVPFALGDTPSQLIEGRNAIEETREGIPALTMKASVKSAKSSSEDRSTKKTVDPMSAVPLSTRTKRISRVRFDDITELSPEQIRASLQDTSDIVLADGEERYSRRRGKHFRGVASKSSEIPLSLFSFPESIVDMWNELNEGLAEDSQPAPSVSHARSPELQLSFSDERSLQLADGGSVSPGQQQMPSPLQSEQPHVTLAEEEPMLLPEIQPIQTTPRQRSAEILRDSVMRQGTPAVLSDHSRSLVGTSGSKSFPSRSGSLRTRAARLRDHIFEMVGNVDMSNRFCIDANQKSFPDN
eukprot:gb/GEZJ01003321.1/.p1 GENE.gb/GEZJ01003321.1/~~gb/GEZJ01003321.1/.p1  ORF type:complete len:565 (-),score=70.11 gb/GEZJ01003321.1/:5626-7320(-)